MEPNVRGYKDVAEVQVCGTRKANDFLRHDYELLGVYLVRTTIASPSGPRANQKIVFVVGRDVTVRPYDPPREEDNREHSTDRPNTDEAGAGAR